MEEVRASYKEIIEWLEVYYKRQEKIKTYRG
ncbi:unnamed protein product, partial [marine sediment metagenome]